MVDFQSSDVSIVVPQGAVPSPATFTLKTYVDPACLPLVESEDEMSLSPAFHLSSSLPQDHFQRALQLFLPLEVPLKASDQDSGWLLQLKRSESSDGVPTEWHTVLELNTKTGEVMFQSSFVHYDHASGTLHLDHFSWLAWLGEALKAVGTMLGFFSPRPLHQILYVVFGKEIQHHKWLIAIHIIHGSKVVYESLVCKMKEEAYVELTRPNNDCIQLDGKVSICIQCLEPWQVGLGKSEVQINTKRIWKTEQHYSCYHEVMVEDRTCSADTLQCTIEASFWAEGDEDAGDSVVLVISHPFHLSTETGTATLSLSLARIPDSAVSPPGEEIASGALQGDAYN